MKLIKHSCLFIVFPAILSVSLASHAAEWKIDPTLQLRAGYNDNIRISIDDQLSSPEVTLIPSAVFSVETPRSGLSGKLRFDFRRFLEESDLDDDNVRFEIDSFHNMERSKIGFEVDMIRDTTLDSQLEESGLVFDREDRLLKRVSPSWIYSLSERSRLEASYSFSDVSYENNASGFVDYTSHTAQVSLNHVINERLLSTVTLGSQLTENDNDVSSTYTYLQGGGAYQFSDTVSSSLFVGVRHTTSEFDRQERLYFDDGSFIESTETERVENSDWGSVFRGSLSKTFERGSSSLSASHDINNTVSGILYEVTRLKWMNNYRFSETLSGDLHLSFYRSRADSELSAIQDRDYIEVNPRLNWKFAQFWKFSAGYRYRKQQYEELDDDAVQNVINLTLTYRWPEFAVSR